MMLFDFDNTLANRIFYDHRCEFAEVVLCKVKELAKRILKLRRQHFKKNRTTINNTH